MKLKTKKEIYGVGNMTNEELKKLANWGFYRFDKRHGDGASVVKVEGVSGEFAVDSPIASCAGGFLGHARQGAVGEARDSTERASNECKYSETEVVVL